MKHLFLNALLIFLCFSSSNSDKCDEKEEGRIKCKSINALCDPETESPKGYECVCRQHSEMLNETCEKISFCEIGELGHEECSKIKNSVCQLNRRIREGFECNCPEYYKENKERKECVEIPKCQNGGVGYKECKFRGMECYVNESSENYECKCPKYKNLIGEKCEDIDTCDEGGLGFETCSGQFSKCIPLNDNNTFECRCDIGKYKNEDDMCVYAQSSLKGKIKYFNVSANEALILESLNEEFNDNITFIDLYDCQKRKDFWLCHIIFNSKFNASLLENAIKNSFNKCEEFKVQDMPYYCLEGELNLENNLCPNGTEIVSGETKLYCKCSYYNKVITTSENKTTIIEKCEGICDGNPCQSNGDCISIGPNEYQCNCKEGYSGSNCEKEKKDNTVDIAVISISVVAIVLSLIAIIMVGIVVYKKREKKKQNDRYIHNVQELPSTSNRSRLNAPSTSKYGGIANQGMVSETF